MGAGHHRSQLFECASELTSDDCSPCWTRRGGRKENLRSQVSPKYRYDEREADLSRCLELDGYRVTGNGLEQIEPTVEGQAVYEDDLSRALRTCNLPGAVTVQTALDQSAEAFRRQPADFNAALTHVRVALQTLRHVHCNDSCGRRGCGLRPNEMGAGCGLSSDFGLHYQIRRRGTDRSILVRQPWCTHAARTIRGRDDSAGA